MSKETTIIRRYLTSDYIYLEQKHIVLTNFLSEHGAVRSISMRDITIESGIEVRNYFLINGKVVTLDTLPQIELASPLDTIKCKNAFKILSSVITCTVRMQLNLSSDEEIVRNADEGIIINEQYLSALVGLSDSLD